MCIHIPIFWLLLFCGTVLDGVLVRLNHLLYHLTADASCLLCGEVAVVTLIEVNANFACSLHLELVKSFLCFGNKFLIACHNFNLLFSLCLNLYICFYAVKINANIQIRFYLNIYFN